MVRIGDKAPDFSLFASDKTKLSLSDFEGKKVVLLFFPLAFTGVCTKELCSVRDSIGLYESLDAQVLAVSVDSIYSLARFKAEQGYQFPLLSDFNRVLSREYGALYDLFGYDMQGVSKRAAFVIDGGGIVRYAEVLESAAHLPDFEAIRQTLAVIQ